MLQDKGFIASALEHWLGSKDDKASVGDEAGVLVGLAVYNCSTLRAAGVHSPLAMLGALSSRQAKNILQDCSVD